jgi:hypothetical protein
LGYPGIVKTGLTRGYWNSAAVNEIFEAQDAAENLDQPYLVCTLYISTPRTSRERLLAGTPSARRTKILTPLRTP